MPKAVPLALLVSLLSACAGITGPARRHLAAVELAERSVPPDTAERRADLERARDELIALQVHKARVPGLELSLATVWAWLGEPERALALRPADEPKAEEERVGWRAVGHWALAAQGRWGELLAAQPDAELAVLATNLRDPYSAGCTPIPPTEPLPGACCAAEAGPAECRECLVAWSGAWCAGGVAAADLLTATAAVPQAPHLALSRARLRASALVAEKRHEEALAELDASRNAAQRLPGDPSTALAQSLELDRALVLGWLGRVDEARTVLSQLGEATNERNAERARGLSSALTPER